LRQLIRFYGDSMQTLVPRFLEISMTSLTREQEKMREQVAQAFGASGFGSLEDQVRRNMEMFERAFTMFAPFGRKDNPEDGEKPPRSGAGGGGGADIDELRRQLDEMQKRLDRLGDKGPGEAQK
jgi:polyhydroxyalkanoate synthesis regulator protein